MKVNFEEADGAIRREKLYAECSRQDAMLDIYDLTTNEGIEQLRIGSNKMRFQYC